MRAGNASTEWRDDVGVRFAVEMKPDRDAARARIRIVVGDGGNPREIGEAHAHRRRGATQVRRTSEVLRAGRGREGAGQHDALGMRRAVSSLHSSIDRIESIEDLATERVELIIFVGGRHKKKFSQGSIEWQNRAQRLLSR